ncbi:Fic family protein [Komagataeibacter europaeus]|uniref:Fic family protein n=1 Tax=Komagataeibacter europaeus TaxID=33995 RepID=UPI0002D737DC|nr:Fic family protein [Komagataeibacter europaeus]
MKREDLAGGIRECLQRLPAPYAQHYGVVPPSPPEAGVMLGDAAARHGQALSALGEIAALARALPDPYLISRVLSRQEALSSSALEGTHSTLNELLVVDEDDQDASHATRQVRDYARTLEQFLPQASSEGPALFRLPTVLALHQAVMQHDPAYRGTPGTLRRNVVWIGGTGHIAYSTYNPPPPDQVAACLEATLDYMRADGMQQMTQSLITRLAIAHAHFEAVHPFSDGNGRVGRLLLPLMMAADGQIPLYLSPYIEAHRQDYYAALKRAQQRLDWPPLIGFLSDAIIRTVTEVQVTRQATQALKATWQQRRAFRKGSTALRALDLLTDYPVLTASRLGHLLDITPPAAQTALAQLCQVGILTERTGYARNRIYAAEDVLTILNRPFGEEPALPDPPS